MVAVGPKQRPLKQFIWILMCLWGMPACAVSFDIPAGDVVDTLKAFIQQTGLQVVFGFDDVRGLSMWTPEIKGDFEPDEGLHRLLQGLPLTYEFITPDAVTITLTSRHEARVQEQAVPLTAADSDLIAEHCQFGRISALRAERLFGVTPGYCWCCHAYDAAYREYRLQRTQYEARYQAYLHALPRTRLQRLVSLVKPRHAPPVPPVEVLPPTSLFCAALRTLERCSIFDQDDPDPEDMDAVVIRTKGTRDESSVP